MANLLNFFKSNKKRFISIDLGTANTLIYVSGQEIVYNQPSIIAYNINTNEVVGVGNDAYKMVGKGNKNISVVRPMKEGVIGDINSTKAQLKYIFNHLKLTNYIKGGIILLACPSTITNLEKAALKKIALDLGAKKVFVEEEVKMAALGGGVNIHLPEGQCVVDIGGGTSDVAIVSSGDIVHSESIKIAGNVLNDEIVKYIRSQFGLDIGLKTSEDIKIKVGSVFPYEGDQKTEVFGRDIITGLPRKIEVSADEIREVLIVPVSKIVQLCKQILEITPPALSGDILKNGITLCGGGAQLNGLAKYLSKELGLNVKLVEDPLISVINGTKKFENDILELVKGVEYNNMF